MRVINILILTCLVNSPLHSQKTTTKFENVNINPGNFSVRVSNIFKDSKGFIWLATTEGLVKYDGYESYTIANSHEKKNSLSGNIIFSINEDQTGNFLVTTAEGLNLYLVNSGEWKNKINSNEYIFQRNYSFSFIDDDKIWLVGLDSLFLYDTTYKLIDKFDLKKSLNIDHKLSLTSIHKDRNGLYWLGTDESGIINFNFPQKSFSFPAFNKDIYNAGGFYFAVYDIVEDIEHGCYWFPSVKGLMKLKFNQPESLEKVDFGLEGFEKSPVTTCVSDGKSLWVGTESGLIKYDKQTLKSELFQSEPYRLNTLINNNIFYIYKDDQNIKWVLTVSGVCKVYSQNFDYYFSDPGNKNSLTHNSVHCFLDAGSYILMGTTSGVSVFDKTTNNFLPASNALKSSHVLNLFYNGKTLFAGCWGTGLIKCNFLNGKFSNVQNYKWIDGDTKSISSDFITGIDEDRNGNIWLSTWNGGLSEIRKNNLSSPEFERFFANETGLKSNYIGFTIIDNNNFLWAGLSTGLQKYDLNSEKYEYFLYDSLDKKNPANITICGHDSKNNLWIGTADGLLLFDKQSGEFTKSHSPVVNNSFFVSSIVSDTSGLLWLYSNNGIYSFNPVTEDFKQHSFLDNTYYPGSNLRSAYRDNENNIYFGTKSGFIKFNPSKLTFNDKPPPVFITSINVYDKPYRTDYVRTINSIELPFDENSVSVTVASLNYIESGKNQYAYQLEGFDKEKKYAGNNRVITYTNLDPGSYELKVYGSNNDDIWNEAGTSLLIKINPPFWQTWWFRIIGVIIVGGTVYGVYRKRVNKIEKERQKQEEFSKQLIESQEAERKRIASELHDGIGQDLLIIKNKLTQSSINDDPTKKVIKEITEIVSESIDEVRNISSSLHPHQLERLGFTKAVESIIGKIRENTSLEIDSVIDNIDGTYKNETELNLYRIIQEIFNNIVKHSGASKVSFNLIRGNGEIIISVNDNGVGFDVNDYSAGLGLRNMQERTKLIGGTFSIASEEQKGTLVKIELKF